jgi:hemerythrin superfamily protein
LADEGHEPAQEDAAPFAVTPTPDDGTRLSSETAWDEAARPRGPVADPSRTYTLTQQATGKHLIDVHDALRAELEQLRELIAQLSGGNLDPQSVRSYMNRMTIRQNNWTLGVYCASYCRIVAGHHSLEDTSVFPHLKGREPELDPVIDRLAAEHEVIANLLERIDAALIALVESKPNAIKEVTAAVDLLTDAMRSHLSYEEEELVEPLARFGFY